METCRFSNLIVTATKNNHALSTPWLPHATCMLSCVRLFVTLWTVACQAPLSLEFPRQEYWSGLPCPSLGDLLNPGIKPESPAWQTDSSPTEPKTWQVLSHYVSCFFCSLRERTFGPATSSLDLLWIDLLWTFLYNSIWWQVFSFLLGKHKFPISSIWMFWLLRIFTNTW